MIRFAADIVGTLQPTGVFVQEHGDSYISTKVHDLIVFFLGVIVISAVVMIIYNGLMFVTAGGDSGKVEKATKGIIYALVGLGIALAAGLVVSFFTDLLNKGMS